MLQSLAEPLCVSDSLPLGTGRRFTLATPALCAYETRIAGTYESGTVHLTEISPNIRSSKVIVTFLDFIAINPMDRFITFGVFSGKNQSTTEDFIIAEFHGSNGKLL